MKLSKEQTKGILISAAALLLIFGGVAYNRKRKKSILNELESKATKTGEQTETKTDAPVNLSIADAEANKKSFSYAEGQKISEEQKAKELYKRIIGLAYYIKTATDANAIRLRKQALAVQKKTNSSIEDAIMSVVIKMNKDKECLKDAVKLIGGDLKAHVDYFEKNQEFKIK
jgi:hypothetical protein